MAVLQAATIERVTGEEGNDWRSVHVVDQAGKNYRLDTKDPDRIAQAVAARGKTVDIDYTQRESRNINERTGKPFINYYFNGVIESSRNGSAADEGVEIVKREDRFKEDPAKAWRISLAAGAKLAVQTLPLMPEGQRSFEAQKRVALSWGHWLFTTPLPEHPPVDGDEIAFGSTKSGHPLDDPPPYLDDDWPPAE